MTITELTFQSREGVYMCGIPEYSKGDIIQVETQVKAPVSVFVNAEGMNPVMVNNFENKYGKTVIFALDIPEGLEVTIGVSAEVVKAILVQE